MELIVQIIYASFLIWLGGLFAALLEHLPATTTISDLLRKDRSIKL